MTSDSSQENKSKGKLDFTTVMRFILSYEEYMRLMLLLFLFGLLSGVVYFVYARAVYQSTSVIRVNLYLETSKIASDSKVARFNVVRNLGSQLGSGYLVLEAAKKIGFAGSQTTHTEFRAGMMPYLRFSALDGTHLQMSLQGYNSRFVREFPQALIDVYEESRLKQMAEFREKAVKRYLDEMKIVREKVAASLDSRLLFEEETALAEAQVQQERLSNVPVQLIQTKHRVSEMKRVNLVLEAQKDTLGVVGKLSLMSSVFDSDDDPLKSGRLIRKPWRGPTTFATPESLSKVSTQVVVQPEMVDGLTAWQDLEKKKRTLEEKIRVESLKYLEDHPEMIKLKAQLHETNSALQLELEVAQTRFEAELSRYEELAEELEKKLPDYYKATKDLDEKRLNYDLLQQGQLAWDKAYEKLSQQIESLQFGENDATTTNLEFRGFTELRSETPISPGKAKLAMMGCLLGLGLSLGVPFLLIRLRTSITELTEFEQRFGIPGIGLVPLSDPKILESVNRSPAIDAKVPNSLLENFRLIRSSILLNRSPLGEPRVIMLTSARPGEGKTTVSANVAWAFASMGEKTLLIDCDLRRGRIHSVAGIPNLPGLTRLLTGQCTLDECLVKSPADNLWMIPRGPIVAGTTELLNTQVFTKLLDQLRGRFTKIILDTPPVLGLSETAFLQNHAEGVVLVVDSLKTNRKDVDDAFQALKQLNAHFYGFVLNRVDFSKRANYYNYYYYSSNYYDSNWEPDETEEKAKEADSRKSS